MTGGALDNGQVNDTRRKLLDGAIATLRDKGIAGTSARNIAAAAGVNQALVFYHFGSVQNALLAALDLVSDRRMRAYQPAFENAGSVTDLARLARVIYEEDLENGYVTVLGEMVAGGVSDPELGPQVVARLEPWIGMVEGKVRALLAGSLFESMVPPRDLAFAIIALYLGMDMLSHLDGDHRRAQSLLELGERYAPLIEALVPARGTEKR